MRPTISPSAHPSGRTVYVLTTALQYFNALEAAAHFELPLDESALFLVRTRASRVSLDEIERLAAAHPWDSVHTAERGGHDWLSTARDRTLVDRPARAVEKRLLGRDITAAAKRIDQLGPPVRRVVLGNIKNRFVQHAANCFPWARLYGLDEGMAIVRATNALRRGDFDPRRMPWSEKLTHRLWGIDGTIDRSLTLFTCFDVEARPGDTVVRNEYKQLRADIAAREARGERLGRRCEMLFVGSVSPWVFVDDDAYLSALRSGVDAVGGPAVLYAPHRHQPDHVVRRIEVELGYEIVRPGRSIELAIADGELRPEVVASFFSTALTTCALMFRGVFQVKAFRIPVEMLRADRRSEYPSLYDHFERNPHIEIVGLA